MPYHFRPATLDDVTTLCHHRRRMFEDMGHQDSALLDKMTEQFTQWVTKRLQDKTYYAWLALDEQNNIVAGAGLWLIDWPPHWLDPRGTRGYILNIYTEPAHRRQGLASQLTQLCIDACKDMGLSVVALHASEHGRSIYESLGFTATNEMRMQL